MTLPTAPPVELNEEQREAAEERGILTILLGGEVKLARVWVPPHMSVTEEGHPYHVKGYWRSQDVAAPVPPTQPQAVPEWQDPGERPTLPEDPDEYEDYRKKREAWADAMGTGVAIGAIEPKEAMDRGWNPGPRPEDIKPLPQELYHATTAMGPVLRDGLRTRDERGSEAGLGGGSGEISLTESREYAERIAEVLTELRSVLNEETSIDDLVERAKQGGFFDRMKQFVETTIGKWDQRVVRRMRQGVTGDITTPEEYQERAVPGEGWRPMPGAEGLTGGDGKVRYSGFKLERPQTDEEWLETLYKVYDAFLWAQGEAGGPTNPVLFAPNLKWLKSLKPQDIGVVRVRPRAGAKGWQDDSMASSEWEWRTWSGRMLEVTPVED